MAQIRIGQLVAATLMLGTTAVQKVFLGTQQVWANEVIIVLANSSSIILSTYFTPEQWADPFLKKRVIVPAGVEIGATNATYAIALTPSSGGQAGSWGGELTLEVRGTVSGIGGAPNSGQGGSAIWGNFAGRDGQRLILNNFGLIRAGGGGGGRGGDGGGGLFYSGRTITEGPFYNISSGGFYGVYVQGATSYWRWNSQAINWTLSSGTTSYAPGDGWTYQRGGAIGSGWYYILRTLYVVDVPNYTAGGVAGVAGRGQGFDGPATAGSAAVAGGQNAGASGKCGAGSGWAVAGQPGDSGLAGNSGGPTAGSAGGLPGFYIHDSHNILLNNLGTVLGRVA